MCRAIASKEFRRKIEAAEEGRPAGIIMEYLDATGYILSNRNGTVEVADDLDEKIKFINGEVQKGCSSSWTNILKPTTMDIIFAVSK